MAEQRQTVANALLQQHMERKMSQQETGIEGRLLPILREGIEMVKMLLFVKLKGYLAMAQPQWTGERQNKITGAVLNEIFGVVNPAPPFTEFVKENREVINAVLAEAPKIFAELLIPLTDALRIMVLCDYQEGADTAAVLAKARENGLLLANRDLALPHTFIELVRRLGAANGLIAPPTATDS